MDEFERRNIHGTAQRPATGARPPAQSQAAQSQAVGQEFIALIDSRRLERECFVRSIELLHPKLIVIGYSSAADFLREIALSAPMRASAILLNIGSRELSDPDVGRELDLLLRRENASPVVVLAPSDDLDHMMAALDAGAAGYVPANVGIDEIIEATKLAASGGVFLKFESLAKLRGSIEPKTSIPPEFKNLTWRQTAVAQALRRGKANKTIAYELNMCESTVKVHIRTIMRKLEARNRTEAAFKLNAILPQQLDGEA